MFGKIAVRNIPEAIWEGLVKLAGQNDRSTEAEARFALKSWVEPQIRPDRASNRREVISRRLLGLLEQVNKVPHHSLLKPSHVAEGIGEALVEPVENWFNGAVEPSLKHLDAIADYLGGAANWLKHGEGSMFSAKYDRVPEDATESLLWLLEPSATEPPTNIHFVRQNDQTGSLAIVKQYGAWRCKTVTVPYNVSEVIGNGGESALSHLSLTWHLLYEYYTKSATNTSNIIVKSYLLSSESYQDLVNGKVHPLNALREAGTDQPWWEDFWDVRQFPQSDYWPGWKALCDRIRRVVESKPALREEDETIRDRTHPFLNRPSQPTA